MMNSKKGISILAVLLFMLIATIAGTATYKWLSSEGKSSASRMFQSEARMAALAGIESARSWIANHGNETGAVVKQFKHAKAKGEVVKLDNQLVAFKKDKQKYSVYVADVDDSQQPYKIKIVSEGSSRDGTAKHSETAVFKVSGLYQVGAPTTTSSVNFDANYFGGSVNLSGRASADAMIVNGNTSGQEINVSKKLVVTGNVSHGSNSISLAKTNCIGGNLENGGQGVMSFTDLYVGGNASSFSYGTSFMANSIYFNGEVTLPTTELGQEMKVNNVTINGTFNGSDMAKRLNVLGDLCLTNTGKMAFNNPEKGGVKVDGNVWVPGSNALSNSTAGTYKNVALGGSGKKAYINNVTQCSGKYKEAVDNKKGTSSFNPNGSSTDCPLDMYYQASGASPYANTNYAMLSTQAEPIAIIPSKQPFNCAEDIKTYCVDNYLGNTKSCTDGTQKLDDLLATAYNYFGKSDYETQCVKDVMAKDFAALKGGAGVNALNKCYENNKSKLYNGYLVVKGSAEKLNYIFTDVGNEASFIGKFIIYVQNGSDTKLSGGLPTTGIMPNGEQSLVFMYLPDGADKLLQNGGNGTYRYFIYSLQDINTIGTSNGSGTWTGSFYFSAENCAKLKSLSTGNNQTLIYDAAMINDLSENSILCNYEDKATCGSSYSEGSSGGSGSAAESSNKDSIRVAVGTNLLVELESQYKTTEKIDKSQNVEASAVVYPRVVYLNSNAKGKLRDYFNPVALNGAVLLGNGSVSCTDNKLVSEPFPELTENTIATCEYKNTSGGKEYKSEFYVKILGAAEEVPNVGFDGESAVVIDPESITGDVTTPVDVNIAAVIDGEGEYSMDIVVTGLINDNTWTLVANTSDKFTQITSTSSDELRYRLKGEISSSDVKASLFTVTNNSSSTTGNLVFVIENATNCNPVAAVKAISLRGIMNVTRASLETYCGLPDDKKNAEYCTRVVTDDYKRIPSCDDMIVKNYGNAYEWVTAYGDGCSVAKGSDDKYMYNDKWTCYTGTSTSLVEKNASNIGAFCDIFIPIDETNTIRTYTNKNQTLYADVKHKVYKLHLDLQNRDGEDKVTIYTSTTAYSSIADLKAAVEAANSGVTSRTCNQAHCDPIDIYAGYHLYLYGEGAFSYWEISETGETDSYEKVQGNPYHVQVVEDVWANAVFNGRDEHCFYDNFSGLKVFCDATSCPSGSQSCNCIDQCTNPKDRSKSLHCSVTSGHAYTNANWTMVYSNLSEDEAIGHDCNLWGENCSWYDVYEPIKQNEDKSVSYEGNFLHHGINIGIYELFKEYTYSLAKNDGRESVVLNHVDAGKNGVMTASFAAQNVSIVDIRGLCENLRLGSWVREKCLELIPEHMLNSGFILRSNADASEYLTLSIYGKNLTASNYFSSLKLYARVCYANKKTLTDKSSCSEEKELNFSVSEKIDLDATKSPWNKLNVEATLNNNTLSVKVGIEEIVLNSSILTKTIDFNLSQSPLKALNDGNHNYVGFKLADKGFKIYDIAWRSNSEDCWDTPYATCSFQANYEGGFVPKDQNVMPWVTTSTWLSNKVASGDCKVTYYYNGCDMDWSRYDRNLISVANGIVQFFSGKCSEGFLSTSTNVAGDGYYWGVSDGDKNGAPLDKDSTYNFKYEGLHGKVVSASTPGYDKSGIVRNASVRVTCEKLGMKRSYLANCGKFWVGPYNECVDNETLLPNDDYDGNFNYSGTEIGNGKALTLVNAVNLRNATLNFTFAEQPGTVSFYLEDVNGFQSAEGVASSTEAVSVESLLNEHPDFNPQQIKKIIFTSTAQFTITEIKSVCANAPTATCIGAQYDANGWTLYGTSSGDACEMSVSDGETTVKGPVVCEQTTAVLSSDAAKNLVNGISTATEYTISLKASKAGSKDVSCEITTTVDPSSVPTPSVSPKPEALPKTASCSKEDGGSYHVVVDGCSSNDDCSIKTQRNDEPPEVACNWVTSDCYVALYYPGTYDILFNDGTSDRRLAGCSGIVFEEGENNE